MTGFVDGRRFLIDRLREELVGPASRGKELDLTRAVNFPTYAEADGPFRDLASSEEILTRDSPIARYGIGVLYPGMSIQTIEEAAVAADPQGGLAPSDLAVPGSDSPSPSEGEPAVDSKAESLLTSMQQRMTFAAGGEQDDFDLSTANSFRPSTVALSFLIELAPGSELNLSAAGGRYEKVEATVHGKAHRWWVRRPVTLSASIRGDQLGTTHTVVRPTIDSEGFGPLKLSLEIHARPRTPDRWLLTACLVNRTAGTELNADKCLFQAGLNCSVSGSPGARILPYPDPPHTVLDAEDQSNALLYRRFGTFAVGHGCAGNWTGHEGYASEVHSENLPVVAVPGISADTVDETGTKIEISIAKLAGLIEGDDGMGQLSGLADAYDRWIGARESELLPALGEHLETARRHLSQCRVALKRLRRGIRLLEEDSTAKRAFQLANEAVLVQQLRYQRQSRAAVFDPKQFLLSFEGAIPSPDLTAAHPALGRWRAFQIAFLLSALPSVHDRSDADRETVELIWFPTGGGKTEAYLALTAYSILHRRLLDRTDSGLEVLMRYTLRLLTAQQFQRASALAVALEQLRRRNPEELGSDPIGIGIWVGGDTTPLRHDEARTALSDLKKRGLDADNPFLIVRCPWCSAQMGPIRLAGKGAPKVVGYELVADRVTFRCPDRRCPFSDELPILVVDEYIYSAPPTIVIGTVDKFAMLAWRPEARSLFGLDEEGKRRQSPPGLIIQDELHLISGPLGSMVGLYEAVIEELCTDRRAHQAIRPKIVSSTATIRSYREQVNALYCRNTVELFPPPGIDAADSFFARYADGGEDESNSKLYLGVHAPGLNSLQTAQVRTYTSLIQSAGLLPELDRDPWWTLICFYNSLRELGGGVSLLQTDIPDYTRVLREREGMTKIRFIRQPLELTGRMSNDEIPRAIEALERTVGGSTPPVDVCLTSNIFEVGMDIDRLSLMAVVGQPKTTSQYIQITGRVGRRWWERPGLIVTLYSPSKPRDRSHFEQFRSYHERLYAQVEPTSVTPFSPATLNRALHAAVVAYCRQKGPASVAASPYPYPSWLIEEVSRLLIDRVGKVDPEEREELISVLKKRAREWESWQRVRWSAGGAVGDPGAIDPPLLIASGSYIPPEWLGAIWPTQQSLRDVDSECQAVITAAYLDTADGVNATSDS